MPPGGIPGERYRAWGPVVTIAGAGRLLGVRIQFLGSGAGTDTPHRAGSSILLTGGGETVLLDCGPRAYDRLVMAGISPASISRIFLSHLHPDHVLGLATFVQAMTFPYGRLPLEIQGPPGTAAYARQAVGAAALVTGMPGRGWGEPLEVPVVEVAPGDTREAGPFVVRTEQVPHAPNLVCEARRFEAEGKAVVYSGDTTEAAEVMVPLAEGAAALIHECYSLAGLSRWTAAFDERRAAAVRRAFEQTHAEVAYVARVAKEAGAKLLVLTHLNPGERADELLDTAAAYYGGPVVIASDGLSLSV